MFPNQGRPPAYITGIMLAAVCAVGLLIYLPGLSGQFIFDDVPNIVHNNRLHIDSLSPEALETALTSGFSGPLTRPVSMLSFALNYYFGGLNPYYYKLTNVVIHLLCGVGLFFLTRMLLGVYRERFDPRLTQRHALLVSSAVSAAWLFHPFNLTSVLYVVQRMNCLSALFVIWGLVLYTAGRWRLIQERRGIPMILTGVLVFTPLAVLSKENGVLLPLYMLVIETTLFGFQTSHPNQRRFLYGLFALILALPMLAVAVYTAAHPQWITAGYVKRDFTLVDRAFTETRALWFYLKQILAPSTSQMALYHDDFTVSRGLLAPPSTLAAVIGLAVLLGVAFWTRRRAPLVALGLLWFFAGHSLESTILPLEPVFEHRNYLPMYGIVMIAVYYLLYPFAFTELLRGRQALAATFLVILAASTALRAGDWGDPMLFAVTEVNHHPQSARANHHAGMIFTALAESARTPADKDKYYRSAMSYFNESIRFGGNNLDGLFGALLLEGSIKKQVDVPLLKTIEVRLRHEPFAANSGNILLRLVQCEDKNKCHFPPTMIGDLFEAALHNPTLTGRDRTGVLLAAAQHLVNQRGNIRDALKLLHQGTLVTPNDMLAHLNYTSLLIFGHRFDLAREQIKEMKALDTWGLYAPQIARQEQKLAKAENPQQTRQDVKSGTTTTDVKQQDSRNDKHGA